MQCPWWKKGQLGQIAQGYLQLCIEYLWGQRLHSWSPSWLFARHGPVWLCLSYSGEPRTGPSFPGVFHRCWVERKDNIPQPVGDSVPHVAQVALGLLCRKRAVLVNDQLLVCRTPKSFSAKLVPSWLAPSLFWCIWLFLPRYRALPSFLLNSVRFLFTYFSSLLRQHNQLEYQPDRSGLFV